MERIGRKINICSFISILLSFACIITILNIIAINKISNKIILMYVFESLSTVLCVYTGRCISKGLDKLCNDNFMSPIVKRRLDNVFVKNQRHYATAVMILYATHASIVIWLTVMINKYMSFDINNIFSYLSNLLKFVFIYIPPVVINILFSFNDIHKVSEKFKEYKRKEVIEEDED